ncbi:hypothetical protein [Acetivibrio cellulolyticus]
MHISDNCYLCENLVFFEVSKPCGYYCKISGQKYCCDGSQEQNCSNYCPENEE